MLEKIIISMKIFHLYFLYNYSFRCIILLQGGRIDMKDNKKDFKKSAQVAPKIEKEAHANEKPKTVAASDKPQSKPVSKKK